MVVKPRGLKLLNKTFWLQIYCYTFKRKPHEIIKYARERLGDEGYNLITENCQHFATECRYGEPQSHEV